MLTKVDLMPTLSAAWKAKVKFLLCGKKNETQRKSKSHSGTVSLTKTNASSVVVYRSGLLSSTCLLLAGELLVGNMSGEVGVEHSAERKAIVPAAAEVRDINILKKRTTVRSDLSQLTEQIQPRAKMKHSLLGLF